MNQLLFAESTENTAKEKKPVEKLKEKLPKKPKLPKNSFNFYWVYAIILVVFVAMTFFDFNSSSQKTNWQDFETKMLRSGDVEKLVVINKENAEVYIKQAALIKEQYKDVPKNRGAATKIWALTTPLKLGLPKHSRKN